MDAEGRRHGHYVGTELDVFAHARSWKRYFRSRLEPFLFGNVLEVGAGLGETTRVLCGEGVRSLTCLEPDPVLAERLRLSAAEQPFGVPVTVVEAFVDELEPSSGFDAIAYVDVLEHIADDRSELDRASRHLDPGGFLMVLSPAHACLFSEFDRAVGHYRRYNRRTLSALEPPGLELVRLHYLDSVGMALSLANRLVLRSSRPTAPQVQFWDRFVIPCSRVIDPLFGWRVGKSVVAIWRRREC